MYDVLIRFKVIKNNKIFEVIFDRRLSFIDNFIILNKIVNINLKDYKVYDPNKKIFLKRNIKLSEFNIDRFIQLHLF